MFFAVLTPILPASQLLYADLETLRASHAARTEYPFPAQHSLIAA